MTDELALVVDPEYTVVSCSDVKQENWEEPGPEPTPIVEIDDKSVVEVKEIGKPEKKSRTSMKCPHSSCTQIFFKQDRLDSHLRSHSGEFRFH